MKRFLMILAMMGLLTSCALADTKVTALTADTSPTTDDLVMTVNDPGGTPASRKVTLANIRTLMLAGNGSSLTGLTKSQVGLGNVENTALSTWAGSANITTLGTIATGSIPESKLTFTDITTGNSSTSKHGFVAKLPNNAAAYYDGTGNWTVPAGGSGGGGGVSSVSIATANGIAGSVANSTTTPVITLQTTVNGILKGNGTSISGATSGTDYAPPTSGGSILKGNGSGGFNSAASGTDYAPATSGSAILKGSGSGGFTSATAGTDYISPTGTETMTNKTLTLPKISSISNTGALTLPTSTDTLIGRATTDTLTNKTFDTAGSGNTFKINGNNLSNVNGNTTIVATVSGATTSTHCAQWDASGNIIDSGATCGSGGGGSGTINSGTSGQLGYYATTGTALSGLSQIGNSYVNWASMTAANQSVNWGGGAEYAASWNATATGVGGIKLYDSSGTNWVAFAAPSTIAASKTWTTPSADGTSGQALVTNGSGTLSFATVAGSGTGTVSSGTSGYLPYYTGTGTTVGQSTLYTDGTNFGINTTTVNKLGGAREVDMIESSSSGLIGHYTKSVLGGIVDSFSADATIKTAGLAFANNHTGSDVQMGALTMLRASGVIMTGGANGDIGLYTNSGASNRLWLGTESVGHEMMDLNGLVYTSGTIPTIGTCGSSPTITTLSTSNSGSFTVGTTNPTTACTITFPAAWSQAPDCVVSDATTIQATKVATTTTTMIVSATTDMHSDKFHYFCRGNI